mmetsp:Transcript_22682/g.33493  ORF Transcript_22682/g.33493 Transcript_22682/m.33493 type:complete len:379 (+) Transcript_22682:66-1202(+)
MPQSKSKEMSDGNDDPLDEGSLQSEEERVPLSKKDLDDEGGASSVRRASSLSPPRSQRVSPDEASYSSSGGSVDSFYCNDDDLSLDQTEPHRNVNSENDLGSFLSEHESDFIDKPSYDGDGDSFQGSQAQYSVSIMSRNSLPYSIQEERSGDEEDENFQPSGYPRHLRSLTTAVVSTPQAYEVLADEYLKLMDSLEEVEEVLDRRKSEKARLTRVLMSKEEEYTERKDRLERMLARIEKLEIQLLQQTSSSRSQSPVNGNGMHKMLKRSQNEAWEALNNSLTMLEKHRSNNRELIKKLGRRPDTEVEQVKMYLQRIKRRMIVDDLEEELRKLRKEVNQLRVKQKERAKVSLLGSEIIVERDNASFTSLTVHSADFDHK